MPKRFRPVAAILLALAVPASGRAESGNPKFRSISFGFSLSARANTWAPASVIVDNPGPATDVVVTAVCEGDDGSLSPVTTRTPMRLPAKSSRLDVVYVRVDNAGHARFELRRGGALLDRSDATINNVGSREFLVLGLSHSNSQNFVCEQRRAGSGSEFRFRFKNLPLVTPLRAPSRWQGYSAANAIILGVLPPEGMTTTQQRAIVNWVRAGGVLVLCPGGYHSNYRGSIIERISPVRELGVRLVETLEPLRDVYGSAPQRLEKGRIGLTEALATDGDTLLSMGPFPLIVTRDEGMGRVVFIAFDVGHDRLTMWKPLRRLYEDLLCRRGAPPPPWQTPMPSRASAFLDKRVGARVVPRSALAAALGANFLLALGALIVMRKRREMGFAALLVAAPLVAVIVNAAGAAYSGVVEPSLAGLHVAQSASGASRAACASYCAAISPAAARVDVGAPLTPSAFPDALFRKTPVRRGRLAAADTQRQRYAFLDADIKWLDDVPVRERSVVRFQATALGVMPGALDVQATLDERGVRFDIVNRSRVTLTEGFVTANRNATAIGALDPGERTTVRLDRGTARPVVARYSRGAARSSLQALATALYAPGRANVLDDTGMALQGWCNAEPIALQVKGMSNPRRTSQTLWVVRARTRAQGSRILVPKGVASRRFESNVSSLYAGGRWIPFTGHIPVPVSFGLPQAVRGLQPTRVTLFLAFEQGRARAAIEAFNLKTRSWDIILGKRKGARSEPPARGSRPAKRRRKRRLDPALPAYGRVEPVISSGTEFPLSEPTRYFNPWTGQIRVRFTALAETVTTGDGASASSANRPVITDLDIEIEGFRP